MLCMYIYCNNLSCGHIPTHHYIALYVLSLYSKCLWRNRSPINLPVITAGDLAPPLCRVMASSIGPPSMCHHVISWGSAILNIKHSSYKIWTVQTVQPALCPKQINASVRNSCSPHLKWKTSQTTLHQQSLIMLVARIHVVAIADIVVYRTAPTNNCLQRELSPLSTQENRHSVNPTSTNITLHHQSKKI